MVWFGRRSLVIFLALICALAGAVLAAESAAETVRVFIFAGQSNMVGSDLKVADIERFAPYAELLPDLAALEPAPRFSYVLGRETKKRSEGWVDLAPVGIIVGPEHSFVRDVARQSNAPIAIHQSRRRRHHAVDRRVSLIDRITVYQAVSGDWLHRRSS